MRIVNKKKFVKTITLLILAILGICFVCAKNTYSSGEVKYKEEYIISGETLWSVAKNEAKFNKYFENKDIRDIIQEIKDVNKLEDSNLAEGQKIMIPAVN